ncbi:uncharacterized protein LOC143891174 [Tasmannia lanceolata]|uniref:uncharacterized protein LOC143891174 n=1 Tax=Tasmannia lanceolata TaxID=3420 RepID=UPI004063A6CB
MLSVIIDEAASLNKIISPFSKGSLSITHLLFADDVLLFAKASVLSAKGINDCFTRFMQCSGLEVNLNKSEVFFSEGDSRCKGAIKDTLNIPQGSLPIKYLGLPLITSRLSAADCAPLISKIHRRIAPWSNRLLSRAGRVELTKSILNSFHPYWAASFHLPASILGKIEKIFRDFIWAGPSLHKSYHPIAWDTICTPKAEGGLGLRKLKDLNKAADMKQIWSIIKKKNSLWVSWFHHKYVRKRNFWIIKNPSKMSWGARTIFNCREEVKKSICYIIGEGKGIDLWTQPWHPDGPIVEQYPPDGEYLNAIRPKTYVHQVLQEGIWDPIMLQRLPSINLILEKALVISSAEDEAIWKDTIDGSFSLKSAWNGIREHHSKIAWASSKRNNRLQGADKSHKQVILRNILHTIRSRCIFLRLDSQTGSRDLAFSKAIDLPLFRSQKPTKSCKWVHPEPGCVKLNCDASLASSSASIGGLLRTNDSLVLAMYSQDKIQMSIQELELEPICHGASLASSLDIDRL